MQSKELTLYLSKDCDAISHLYGEGHWHWRDNNLVVELSEWNGEFTIA